MRLLGVDLVQLSLTYPEAVLHNLQECTLQILRLRAADHAATVSGR